MFIFFGQKKISEKAPHKIVGNIEHSTPLNLSAQLNTTEMCQIESVLSWSPRPYPLGTFSCNKKWKKMDILCLTELRFGKHIFLYFSAKKNLPILHWQTNNLFRHSQIFSFRIKTLKFNGPERCLYPLV